MEISISSGKKEKKKAALCVTILFKYFFAFSSLSFFLQPIIHHAEQTLQTRKLGHALKTVKLLSIFQKKKKSAEIYFQISNTPPPKNLNRQCRIWKKPRQARQIPIKNPALSPTECDPRTRSVLPIPSNICPFRPIYMPSLCPIHLPWFYNIIIRIYFLLFNFITLHTACRLALGASAYRFASAGRGKSFFLGGFFFSVEGVSVLGGFFWGGGFGFWVLASS